MAKFDPEVLALVEQAPLFLAGISGGRDSMALLHMLEPFSQKLTVLHVNYQTRRGSFTEEEIVKKRCALMKVPCLVLRAEGCSLDMPNFEAYARAVRYGFYKEKALALGSPLVLTAQHRDDLAETVLLRLLRGSSRFYMKKIRPLAEGVLLARPLLDYTRQELTAHCLEGEIPWRDDESNESPAFLRNFLRHEIFPALRAKVPNLDTRLALAASLRQEEEDFLGQRAAEVLRELGQNPRGQDFLSLHPALARRILAIMFEGQGLPAPGARLAREILRKLRDARGGIVLHSQGGRRLILRGGRLLWGSYF